MNKSELIITIIILLSFATGIYLYPRMPGKMASHWDIAGEVDGYIPKFWGLFLMPFISAGLFLLFILVPIIDPLKDNIKKFRKYFDNFIALVILFLFYLYILTLLWNLGARFNIIQFLSPAFGLLFYYAGILISHTKRNWFIGIRTPWTLSSDAIWEKTHKIGGELFKISGAIAILGIFLPDYAMFFVLLPAISIVVAITVFSYLAYRKEETSTGGS